MEVDTATSAIQTPAKQLLPELEIYYYLLVLLFLINQKRYNEVGYCMLIILSTSPTHDLLYAVDASIFHFRPKLVPRQALIG